MLISWTPPSGEDGASLALIVVVAPLTDGNRILEPSLAPASAGDAESMVCRIDKDVSCPDFPPSRTVFRRPRGLLWARLAEAARDEEMLACDYLTISILLFEFTCILPRYEKAT